METPATRPATAPAPAAKPTPPAPSGKKSGGYYQDDGPGENAPANVEAIPDATPRIEPPHRFANRPYTVLGKTYTPLKVGAAYRARGIASWYGRKFNGQKTSSGEIYDMYAMTAAHPTLPIPSYARVTNPANGKSVIVRVNDRGPFHANRIMDLSYTAAAKLGYIGSGSAPVEVESINADTYQAASASVPAAASAPPPVIAAAPAPASASMPAPAPENTATAPGHYLQLGAFSSRDNAESLRARLAMEMSDIGGADGKLVIQSTGALHRVQLGPYPDEAAARRAAEQVRAAFDYKPVVVKR